MSTNTTKNTVLIAGAGLGGLCLAQALKKHSIPFKIFERDMKQNFRAQGYRLRISEFGILSLQYALDDKIWDLFDKTAALFELPGPKARINTFTAEPLAQGALGGGPPPGAQGDMTPYTVDRTAMRDVLLTGLEDELQFGKAVSRYEESADGVTVYFNDGSSETGALLVGADGVKSTIRQQLLPEYPFLDTEMRIMYGKSPLTAELKSKFLDNAQHGMSLLYDDGSMDNGPKTGVLEAIKFPQGKVVAHISLPDDYIYWVLVVRKEHMPIPDAEVLRLDNEASSDLALTLTDKWHPRVRAIIELQDRTQTSTLRMTSVDPEMPDWEATGRVTLLGDAIHALPPTGGAGVNTALRDAADLAQKIVQAGGSANITRDIVAEYEKDLREFARKWVGMSWQAGQKAFGLKSREECRKLTF
jgi:2-polyprenyl-6-methoxyphenol hydroxylase-like FAD-dependent oxidoreductase